VDQIAPIRTPFITPKSFILTAKPARSARARLGGGDVAMLPPCLLSDAVPPAPHLTGSRDSRNVAVWLPRRSPEPEPARTARSGKLNQLKSGPVRFVHSGGAVPNAIRLYRDNPFGIGSYV